MKRCVGLALAFGASSLFVESASLNRECYTLSSQALCSTYYAKSLKTCLSLLEKSNRLAYVEEEQSICMTVHPRFCVTGAICKLGLNSATTTATELPHSKLRADVVHSITVSMSTYFVCVWCGRGGGLKREAHTSTPHGLSHSRQPSRSHRE